jgi:TDG/mug DNA glycosylase family protein
MIGPDSEVLPDVLRPGLKVAFCGMAAGRVSARIGVYYAGPGNRFWRILHEIGLTPRQLAPADFRRLPDYGIGLTDIEKRQAGSDAELDFARIESNQLRERILHFAPRVLAFNGKRAAQQFCGRRRVEYGLQPERVGATAVFVLPSTSGRNAHWSRFVHHWYALAEFVRALEQAGENDIIGVRPKQAG